MKTKGILLIVACVTIIYACYEDKGNYDYIVPNTVDIAFRQGSTIRDIPIGKLFQINPILEFDNPKDSAGFEYIWVMEEDTIGREKDLNYVFGKTYTEEPLYFYAKDPKSGYTSYARLLITSVSELAKGWVLLSENEEGGSVLGFVRPIKGGGEIARHYEPYPDLYKTLHPGEELGYGPVGLGQLFNKESSRLNVLQESGSVLLIGEDYQKDMDFYWEFIGKSYPEGFVPKHIEYGYAADAVLSQDGKLYTKSFAVMTMWQLFYHTQFSVLPTRFGGNVLNIDQITQSKVFNNTMILAYDKANKRILCVGSGSSMAVGVVLQITGTGGASGFVPLNNLGDYEVLHMGPMDNGAYIILKKGNEYRLQSFAQSIDFMGYNCTVSPSIPSPASKVIPETANVSENSVFFLLRGRPYLFFAEQGKLYWMDTNSLMVYEFYNFNSGKVVKIGHNPQQSELGVALDNGEFFLFNIQDEKMKQSEILFQTSGFGKVVDMIYKFENSGSYSNNQAD